MKVTVEDRGISYTAESKDDILFHDFVENVLKPAVCSMYSEFQWDEYFGNE